MKFIEYERRAKRSNFLYADGKSIVTSMSKFNSLYRFHHNREGNKNQYEYGKLVEEVKVKLLISYCYSFFEKECSFFLQLGFQLDFVILR